MRDHEGLIRRRDLPHIDVEGKPIFITACLQELARSQMHLDVKHRRTPREVISHSIQSYTATQCNRLLGKTGAFWQTETFDHFARDEAETLRIIDYIEQNPVVEGLVKKPAEHRWSSAYLRQILGIQPGEAIPKIAVA